MCESIPLSILLSDSTNVVKIKDTHERLEKGMESVFRPLVRIRANESIM